MDKELPKSKMTVKPGKLFVKLSKSQLPGQKPFYKGTLPNHPTLTIEDIAARAVKARSSYRHGTFVEVFRTMIEEMYGAIHDGFRPSPRLNQLIDSFPAEVSNFNANAPLPNELSIYNERHEKGHAYEFCCIPSDYTLPLFIHGQRVKVMGDHPDVGIVIRQEEGDKRYFIEPRFVFINQTMRLAFMIPEALTPGRWVAEVHSQYTPTYHLYKKPRVGTVAFTVLDTASPG